MLKKGLEILGQVLGISFVTTVIAGIFSVLVFGLLGYLIGPSIGQSQARLKLKKDEDVPEAPIITKARGYKWMTASFAAFLALVVFLLLAVFYGGGWSL